MNCSTMHLVAASSMFTVPSMFSFASKTGSATDLSTPPLKPTKKSRKVAGIECRVVHELENDKPVIEHCMANSARLGITEREVISMARTFEMARNRDLDWLTAVSNKPLEQGYLRIPREYTEIKPDTDEEAAAEAKSEPEPE